MANCTKSLASTLGGVAAIIYAALFIGGCTNVDDTLGREIIPKDQIIEFKTTLMGGVDTYLAKSDSIPTSNLGRLIIGSIEDPVYGRTACSGVLQFVPTGFYEKVDTTKDYVVKKYGFYGFNPEVDSVILNMGIGSIYGKGDVEQEFYVYEFSHPLTRNLAYYPSFEIDDMMVNFDKPIFSFKMKDEIEGVVSKKLVHEAGAKDFLYRLANIDTLRYNTDLLFRESFNGLYIAKAPGSVVDGAIYDMSPLAGDYEYTYLSVFGHNKDIDNPEKNKDSLLVYYSFDDNPLYVAYPNTSITKITHKYTGSIDESTFIDVDAIEKEDEPVYPASVPNVYVQGMVGVSTYLRFSDSFVDELKSKAVLDGKECVMMVNRALMYIWMEDGALEYLDEALPRIGMYYNMKGYGASIKEVEYYSQSSDLRYLMPTAIPDYMAYQEILYSSDNYISTYSGALQRGSGFYQMDISMYLRELANKPETTQRGIWLAPLMKSGAMFTCEQTALLNNAKRIEVDVAYTLVKKKE